MHNRLAAILITSLLFVTACKQEEEKLTAGEAKEFSVSFQDDIAARKMDFMEKRIILPALLDRIALSTKLKHTSAVGEGIRTALAKHEMERNILKSLDNNGTFQLVKQYEKEGRQRLLYRSFGADGLNYLDIELTKLKNRIGIADIFIYLTGENLSKSMAEMFEKMMQHSNDKIAENTINGFQTVKKLLALGNFEAAKKEFDRLPYSIRNTRLGEVTQLQIVSRLDEKEYLAVLDRIEKKYAGEPNIQLMLIDIYILKKDYDKVLAAVDKLDQMINKDPLLDYYRGITYNMKTDDSNAILYYEKAVQSMPDFAEPRAELVAHYGDLGNVEKAKEHYYQYKKLKTAKQSMINYLEDAYPFLNN